MMPHPLSGATSPPVQTTVESSLATECLLASAILIVLLSIWEYKTLAFWCWGFYRSRRRDKAVTAALFGVEGSLIVALTSILPILTHAFGVVASGAYGKAFLIAEAVAAGAAAVAGLSAVRRRDEADGNDLRTLLQRAGQSAQDALDEWARDSVADVLMDALVQDNTRGALLRRLRSVLAQGDPDPLADLVTRNLARAWPALSDAQRDIYSEALSRYVLARRIPPHRLVR